jgi:predicted amidohydrolase YtcJ
MTDARADMVVTGQIVVEAHPDRLETAEALAIAEGRVVATGTRRDLLSAAPGAAHVKADGAAVVPGLHDFHLHLVGMARARRSLDLAAAKSMDEIVARVADLAVATGPDEWVRGDGWTEEVLDPGQLDRLEAVLGGRPAFLKSHDRHSAWASAAALRLAGIGPGAADPEGGRFERDPQGHPSGVLRERAADLVGERAGRLSGAGLQAALGEVVDELLAFGFTGATDAGDATAANGVGTYRAMGESFSQLVAAARLLDGRLEATLDIPAAAIDAASLAGLRTGASLAGSGTLRMGWAKVYADGALGSRTAAVFAPYRCGGGTGILRLEPAELDDVVRRARRSGIGLAIHAIGDRAASSVVDALERGPRPGHGVPPDRMEHLQLIRASDRRRLAALDVTASVQPLHAPADRDTAERCWPDRLADAYPWRSLAAAGARLAFGSDAPIEPPDPWRAIHAAVHRRVPEDPGTGWLADEGVSLEAALAAYTMGPALGAGRSDIGHLHPGARADLAVLSCDLDTLKRAGSGLARVRSDLTMVRGRVVHRR